MSVAAERLAGWERLLLLVPLAGGVVFGVLPLLLPVELARATGYVGDDPYSGRLAGAATLGYAVALALGLREGTWTPLRITVVAVLVFNVASIYGCLAEIGAGRAQPVVYLILATSVAISLIALLLLARHSRAAMAPDVAAWVLWVIAVATALATAFGFLPLLAPEVGRTFGFPVTDTFVYRQGGASTLGYAAMGVLQLHSRRWEEIRLSAVMALVFNGASAIASVLALLGGESRPLIAVIALAAGAIALLTAVVISRAGR